MGKVDPIDKLIDYLQALKKRGGQIDHVDIEYGMRDSIPGDKNYCDWANFQVPDDSFLIQAHGYTKPKNKRLYKVGGCELEIHSYGSDD